MQVLQLTPEQIAMLPPEQRQSILILKEQIQKTASGAPWQADGNPSDRGGVFLFAERCLIATGKLVHVCD